MHSTAETSANKFSVSRRLANKTVKFEVESKWPKYQLIEGIPEWVITQNQPLNQPQISSNIQRMMVVVSSENYGHAPRSLKDPKGVREGGQVVEPTSNSNGRWWLARKLHSYERESTLPGGLDVIGWEMRWFGVECMKTKCRFLASGGGKKWAQIPLSDAREVPRRWSEDCIMCRGRAKVGVGYHPGWWVAGNWPQIVSIGRNEVGDDSFDSPVHGGGASRSPEVWRCPMGKLDRLGLTAPRFPLKGP